MARIRMLAAALAATLLPSLALAQASAPMGVERPTTGAPGKGSTTTRAERKAATLEARKKHELVPASGQVKSADSGKKSSKTRAQANAEVMEARKKGELVPAGGGGPAPSK